MLQYIARADDVFTSLAGHYVFHMANKGNKSRPTINVVMVKHDALKVTPKQYFDSSKGFNESVVSG